MKMQFHCIIADAVLNQLSTIKKYRVIEIIEYLNRRNTLDISKLSKRRTRVRFFFLDNRQRPSLSRVVPGDISGR
jgi:hypothetical protein